MGTPKGETASLWGVPFSSSFKALNLIFKELFESWCFAAEMVVHIFDMDFA